VSARASSSRGERVLRAACLVAVAAPLLVLTALIVGVVVQGAPHLDLDFLLSGPSRFADRAGLYPAAIGSLTLIGLTAALAVPVGVGAAIYLQEYGGQGRWARLVEANIATLAGVPSVLYGLVGLEVFVRALGLGRSLAAGALTLAMLALPIVIIAAREALRAVPHELREAGLALGATRWQMVWQVVLPVAAPGILTGIILATSRALGEAAPLLVLGAVVFASDPPTGWSSPFTALPLQIFQWASRPQEAFAQAAAAGIVVLMVTLLLLNATAIALRDRARRRGA